MGPELNDNIASSDITSNDITSVTGLCAAELEVNEDTTSQNALHTASAAVCKAAFDESCFSQYVPIYEKARIAGSPLLTQAQYLEYTWIVLTLMICQ